MEATKDTKMGNSQAALTQLNMTRQGLTSAERTLVLCNNINNVGYCEEPLLEFLNQETEKQTIFDSGHGKIELTETTTVNL